MRRGRPRRPAGHSPPRPPRSQPRRGPMRLNKEHGTVVGKASARTISTTGTATKAYLTVCAKTCVAREAGSGGPTEGRCPRRLRADSTRLTRFERRLWVMDPNLSTLPLAKMRQPLNVTRCMRRPTLNLTRLKKRHPTNFTPSVTECPHRRGNHFCAFVYAFAKTWITLMHQMRSSGRAWLSCALFC